MLSSKTKSLRILLLVAAVGAFCTSFFFAPPQHAAINKPYPVLLIHGLASDPTSWKKLPEYLEKRGFEVYAMDFNDWNWLPYASKKKKDFRELAAVIARQIGAIKKETGRDKVNIIAHSIAGIAVRAYIAGWGAEIEKRGRYSNDISRVIYLSTPHYGINLSGPKLRKLLKETDYGDFMFPTNIMRSITYGSKELLDLHDFWQQNASKLAIEELTVSSKKDNVVKEYCANLDGAWINPLEPPSSYESHHVHLQQFRHAYATLLGRSNRTILGVGGKSHAVLGIASNFFKGELGWRKYNTENRRKSNIVILRFASGGGFHPRDLNLNNTELKRMMAKRGKRAKLKRNLNSYTFYTFGLTPGKFELVIPYKYDYQSSFKFYIELDDGIGTVIDFNPADPPRDPEAPIEPVNGNIPAMVDDLASLKQYVAEAFPYDAYRFKPVVEIKVMAESVRDALAKTYKNLSVYSDDDLDRIQLKDKETEDEEVIDYVDGVNQKGVFYNKLTWTVLELGGGGGGGGGGNYPEDPPTDVYNYTTLKEFVLWYLGDEAYAWQSPNIKWICGKVRDKLAQTYPNIERVNDQEERYGYSAPDDRHCDAIYLVRQATIIDFATGSSDPGILINKLAWGVQPITPW